MITDRMPERILEMVGKKLKESMLEGCSILAIKVGARTRSRNYRTVVHREYPDMDIDEMFRSGDWDKIKESRFKYLVLYIGFTEKRILDLTWIEVRRHRFDGLSTAQIFSLVKLKEKLQKRIVIQEVISTDSQCEFSTEILPGTEHFLK